MTSVKHISLHDHKSFKALTNPDSDLTAIFPQLESLSFVYVDSSHSTALQHDIWLPNWRLPKGDGVQKPTASYTNLCNFVHVRAKAGIPLRHLYFHQAEAAVSALRQQADEDGVNGLQIADLIHEDPGVRVWREKGVYTSDDPRWW